MKINPSKERIASLVKAYIDDSIRPEEMDELFGYVQQHPSDTVLEDLMADYWNTMELDEQLEIPNDKVYDKITSDHAFGDVREDRKVIFLNTFRRFSAYAAVVVLLFGVGVTLFLLNQKSAVPATQSIAQNKAAGALRTGSKKAVLTLADGSQIILEDADSAAIATNEHVILDRKNGHLAYHQQEEFLSVPNSDKNSISTPKGGEYQLVLPDGTKVWLNTASTFSYPVVFGGRERRVKIMGEAYFEVAKHANMPFIVEANGTEVEVLGTHFNVNAYADDAIIKTTLIEGSVKVSRAEAAAILKPNQQSSINVSTGYINVQTVDVEQSMAWKNGYFMFRNEDIRTVMKVIARWYDIDVEYKGDLARKTFGGTISRFANISDLLQSIELTNAIHFQIQGKKIVVMP